MRRTIRNNSGLTAVEVIVAAVILVIVAVALLGLYNNNFGWIVGAGFRTEALDEAKSAIDQLIATGPAVSATDTVTISDSNSGKTSCLIWEAMISPPTRHSSMIRFADTGLEAIQAMAPC